MDYRRARAKARRSVRKLLPRNNWHGSNKNKLNILRIYIGGKIDIICWRTGHFCMWGSSVAKVWIKNGHQIFTQAGWRSKAEGCSYDMETTGEGIDWEMEIKSFTLNLVSLRCLWTKEVKISRKQEEIWSSGPVIKIWVNNSTLDHRACKIGSPRESTGRKNERARLGNPEALECLNSKKEKVNRTERKSEREGKVYPGLSFIYDSLVHHHPPDLLVTHTQIP